MSDLGQFYVPTLNAVWNVMLKFGVDPRPVFAHYDLTEEDLQDSNRRCHSYIEIALWQHAENVIKEPCLGLSAGRDTWHPSQLGTLGYAWLASATLRSALHRLSRFLHLVTNAYEIIVEDKINQHHQQLSVVTIHYKKHSPAFKIRSEAIIATLLCMCRMNFGNALQPRCVAFIHDEPKQAEKYYELFGSDVSFNARHDSIAFLQTDIDKPLPSANHVFAEMMDQSIIRTLAQLEKGKTASRVKSFIVDQLSCGKVTESKVAAQMNMGKRNLQLKLAEENIKFKDLLDEIRTDLAKEYLHETGICLSEVAFLLGFSEVSSFSRAFKRWTGFSPGQYQKSIKAQGMK